MLTRPCARTSAASRPWQLARVLLRVKRKKLVVGRKAWVDEHLRALQHRRKVRGVLPWWRVPRRSTLAKKPGEREERKKTFSLAIHPSILARTAAWMQERRRVVRRQQHVLGVQLPSGPLFGGCQFCSSAANIHANRTRFWPQPVRPTPPVFPCPRGGSKPARGRAAGISCPPCASAATAALRARSRSRA